MKAAFDRSSSGSEVVGEHRCADDVVVARQASDEPLDTGRVVRARKDVVAREVEPARKVDGDLACEVAAEKLLGRGATDVVCVDDAGSTAFVRTFYDDDPDAEDPAAVAGGLAFPGEANPDYWISYISPSSSG